MNATLVIGIGNPDRGDDGAGLEVARRLRLCGLPQADLLECDGEATALMAAWRERARVIVVDAALGGGQPGSVRRFVAHLGPLSARLQSSTHAWGLSEALELARSLGQLPPCVIVYALEGRSFEPGARLSAAALRAVEQACEQVLAELQDTPREASLAGS